MSPEYGSDTAELLAARVVRVLSKNKIPPEGIRVFLEHFFAQIHTVVTDCVARHCAPAETVSQRLPNHYGGYADWQDREIMGLYAEMAVAKMASRLMAPARQQ